MILIVLKSYVGINSYIVILILNLIWRTSDIGIADVANFLACYVNRKNVYQYQPYNVKGSVMTFFMLFRT